MPMMPVMSQVVEARTELVIALNVVSHGAFCNSPHMNVCQLVALNLAMWKAGSYHASFHCLF